MFFSQKLPICCQGTKFENACFWDKNCIDNCFEISCCGGYCKGHCNDCEVTILIDKAWENDGCTGCVQLLCLILYWFIPTSILIFSSFLMMVLFFTFFMSPMIFAFLGLPFLRAKDFNVFHFIETSEIKANSSVRGMLIILADF